MLGNLLEKLIYVAAACGVLLTLGLSLQGTGSTVVDANPIKANQAQYDRIQDSVFFAENSK